MRSVIYMRRPTDEEASGSEARDLRIVERLKGNFAPAGAELRLTYWRGQFGLADKAEASAPAFDVYASEVRVMTAIRKTVEQRRLLSLSKTSPRYAPKILKAYQGLERISQDRILSLLMRMLERGEIREAHVGKPSRYSTFIVPADQEKIAGEIDPTGSA